MVPTTENTDRYFKNDLIQHDTRGMGRDIHVVLSPKMTSLPRDIRACYITTYSLKGNDDKVFEHPVDIHYRCNGRCRRLRQAISICGPRRRRRR